jgi:acetylcholinesterase
MHWDTNISRILGASHISHTPYKTYELAIREMSRTQDELASTLTAYLTSIITTGDPNEVQGYLGQGRPYWGHFNTPYGAGVMVMGEGNDERGGGNNPGKVAYFDNHSRFGNECDF